MAKNDNLTDFLTDVAEAIREKKGTTEKINPQNFSDEIRSIESGGSGWTGHADVEGLRAIGWDDEDIAYYQKHGVDWMEEDDEYHKVSDDNKALYGVLTADNIQEYKDRIVYLPKIDTSGVGSASAFLSGLRCLVATPKLSFSKTSNLMQAFLNCYSLACVNPLEILNVADMSNTYGGCYSLALVPPLDTSEVFRMSQTFINCYNLTSIHLPNTSKVTSFNGTFINCYSLVSVELDMVSATIVTNTFNTCISLVSAKIKNVTMSISLKDSALLSKESLLYIINNEATTSAITITLHSYAYSRLAEDADIVEALNNHPLVSLASA